MVYVANQSLFMHSLRDLTTKVIEGTEQVDPSEPVFSPDGAWIAYWSNGTLKKIPAVGGGSVRLAEIDNPFGLSWAGDQILVGQSRSILQVPANGGPPRALVAIEQTVGDWIQSPQLIDEGRAVLFTLRTDERDWNRSNIIVQDLGSGTRTTLVQGGTDGRALPGGVLIYAQESALFAVAFDEHRRETSGRTVPLERDVLPSVGGFSGASQVSWSPSGSLANANQGRWQVSTSGGTSPRWSRDGRELYFLATGSGGAALQYTLTAVPVNSRPSFATGTAVELGRVPSSSDYDVSADGRILMSVPASNPGSSRARQRIVVVQHWIDDLRSRMATGAR